MHQRFRFLFVFLVWVSALFAAHEPAIPKQEWSWQGPLGKFDRAELQRGFQVYKQVCATCHSLHLLSYRNLLALYAGDARKEAIVKAIASEYKVADTDEEGQAIERSAGLSDRFVSPYPNDKAARAANNGALPVDLSLITKARVGGADYLYALLTGYRPAPAGIEVPQGMHYNETFPGHFIAMPAPLSEGLVEYASGQPKATVDRMARDVTAFLAWASEPELETRKQEGFMVLLFLSVLTLLLYLCMKKVWARAQLD